MTPNPSAAILVIGNEILSGRTQDTNSNTIAKFLSPLGIDLAEIRVVPDIEVEIVAALNALRFRYRYVFTTGGIGPTHDDITADAVAAAFGVGIDFHPEALAVLAARFSANPSDFNPMRRRMARIPDGASLIKNPISAAPGFQIDNVFVLAGVPSIMQAMLEDVAPRLATGQARTSVTISARIAEGAIAAPLQEIQARWPDVAIGSYPFYRPDGYGVQLIVRGLDPLVVQEAGDAIVAMLHQAGAETERV